MLAGENHAAHPGVRERADDRVGVEPGGLEKVRVLVAIAPFLVREGVDREMQERGGLEFVPAELPFARDRQGRGPQRRGGRGGEKGASREHAFSDSMGAKAEGTDGSSFQTRFSEDRLCRHLSRRHGRVYGARRDAQRHGLGDARQIRRQSDAPRVRHRHVQRPRAARTRAGQLHQPGALRLRPRHPFLRDLRIVWRHAQDAGRRAQRHPPRFLPPDVEGHHPRRRGIRRRRSTSSASWRTPIIST